MSTAPEHKNALEKEFELERVILFSDAVFAIAITILVIDIKFPEVPKGAGQEELLSLFKPAIFEFLAFAISFFFIGNFWSKHLKLFRYLKTYDQRLINLNLLFLFFIVMFPFTASGIAGHIRPHFMLPIYIYMINVMLVAISHFLLCRHVFFEKAGLTIEGEEPERKYLLTISAYTAIALVSIVVLSFIVRLLFPENDLYFALCFYILPFLMGYARRKAKKFKPVKAIV